MYNIDDAEKEWNYAIRDILCTFLNKVAVHNGHTKEEYFQTYLGVPPNSLNPNNLDIDFIEEFGKVKESIVTDNTQYITDDLSNLIESTMISWRLQVKDTLKELLVKISENNNGSLESYLKKYLGVVEIKKPINMGKSKDPIVECDVKLTNGKKCTRKINSAGVALFKMNICKYHTTLKKKKLNKKQDEIRNNNYVPTQKVESEFKSLVAQDIVKEKEFKDIYFKEVNGEFVDDEGYIVDRMNLIVIGKMQSRTKPETRKVYTTPKKISDIYKHVVPSNRSYVDQEGQKQTVYLDTASYVYDKNTNLVTGKLLKYSNDPLIMYMFKFEKSVDLSEIYYYDKKNFKDTNGNILDIKSDCVVGDSSGLFMLQKQINEVY